MEGVPDQTIFLVNLRLMQDDVSIRVDVSAFTQVALMGPLILDSAGR